MPPKLDKSHGFMQSIIQNQVLRDDYDKQQKILETEKQYQEQVVEVEEAPKAKRTPRRAPRLQLYVPPHVKSKDNDKPREPSPKGSPEPSKRASREINISNKRDLKRTRRGVPLNSDKSKENPTETEKVLFRFEYEDNSGAVRTFLVKEDDNAEDLAETFGNQLGLTKSLKKALHHKLSSEIKSCFNLESNRA